MEQQHQAAAPPHQPPQFSMTTTDVHLTPVANPTPTHQQLPSSHPSYAEMITAAILWDSSQGKAGGSSKRAIAKYIDRVYTNLPPTHSALLTHHLKRLKNSGHLVMIKNSYQLPVVAAAAHAHAHAHSNANVNSNANANANANANTGGGGGGGVGSATSAVPIRSAPPLNHQSQFQQQPPEEGGAGSVTPKRRPGRPPKAKPEAQPSGTPAGSAVKSGPTGVSGNGTSGGGKRPRGRPPRQQPAVSEVPFVVHQPVPQPRVQPVFPGSGLGGDNDVGGQQSSGKRRPGRPPKKKQQFVQPVQPVYEAQFQPTGQDMVVALSPTENGTVSKRRPGRPPKKNVGVGRAGPIVGGSKPRGRPKRNALAPVSRAIGKKPRGRPPRNLGVVPVGGFAVGKGRGRGRPPKGSGGPPKPLKPMRKYTGKPRGRPKKDASTVGKQKSKQLVANEELTRKVENMQARIRDAVGVIRPYIADENATDALTALQQLEDLSALNINASPLLNEPPVTATSVNAAVQIQPSTSVPASESITVPTVDPPVVPFSIAAPTMNETAPPLYAPPSTIEIEQPTSWIPSSEAHL